VIAFVAKSSEPTAPFKILAEVIELSAGIKTFGGIELPVTDNAAI
jgi:hypothetical protein